MKVQFDTRALLNSIAAGGYTYKELSEKAGVTPQTVRNVLAGKLCRTDTAGKIAQAVGMELSEVTQWQN